MIIHRQLKKRKKSVSPGSRRRSSPEETLDPGPETRVVDGRDAAVRAGHEAVDIGVSELVLLLGAQRIHALLDALAGLAAHALGGLLQLVHLLLEGRLAALHALLGGVKVHGGVD